MLKWTRWNPAYDDVGDDVAEQIRINNEQTRLTNEAMREDAEGMRVIAEENRQKAEAVRLSNEDERIAAERARQANELERQSYEEVRQINELSRIDSESERAIAEAKRVADFADMQQRAKGLQRYICQDGEYDADRKPVISEPDVNTLYLVPAENPDDDNSYLEYIWVNDSNKAHWEPLGATVMSFLPISTEEIDGVIGGDTLTGASILNLTGLSYLISKLKDWANKTFAPMEHIHGLDELELDYMSDTDFLTALGGNSSTDDEFNAFG